VDGKPMPRTEVSEDPVVAPNGQYRPMALGPTGRSWEPRFRYGGTYDQQWLENVFPFLPSDFDEAYYQASPEDQQTDHLQGGEEVVLRHLGPVAQCAFRLPTVTVPLHFFRKGGGRMDLTGVADTLVLEPDDARFTITWRAHLPLKKNIFEVAQALVGQMSRGWWRARKLGKTYHSSLATAVRDRPRKPEAEA
jgi:hypothetical protein